MKNMFNAAAVKSSSKTLNFQLVIEKEWMGGRRVHEEIQNVYLIALNTRGECLRRWRIIKEEEDESENNKRRKRKYIKNICCYNICFPMLLRMKNGPSCVYSCKQLALISHNRHMFFYTYSRGCQKSCFTIIQNYSN